MYKIMLFIIILSGCSSVALAQKKDPAAKRSCSCGFSSINSLGFVEGGEGSAFLVQTINGFRYKTWFIGAGVGLDYYHLRGIPVFLDLRKNILTSPNSPFLYADAGVHYAWARDKDKESWQNVDFSNGAYYDAGIGYSFRIRRNNALLFSLGYSYKYLEKNMSSLQYCPYFDCPIQVESYKYRLNRLTLKTGFRF